MIDIMVNAAAFYGLGLMALACCAKFAHLVWLVLK